MSGEPEQARGDCGPCVNDPESGITFNSIHDYWLYYAKRDGVASADARYDRILSKFVKSAEAAVGMLNHAEKEA